MLLLLSGEGHSTVWRGQVHPSKEVHAACGLRAKLEPHRVPGDPKLLTQLPPASVFPAVKWGTGNPPILGHGALEEQTRVGCAL